MVFMVTDRPGSRNASYLIDFENYAPEAQIGLPTDGAERIQLLVAAIESIFTVHGANRVCIAVTDSSEIDSVQHTLCQDLRDVLINDFREMAPPCRLYDIWAANT